MRFQVLCTNGSCALVSNIDNAMIVLEYRENYANFLLFWHLDAIPDLKEQLMESVVVRCAAVFNHAAGIASSR